MTRDDWMHDLRRVDEIKAIPAANVRPVVRGRWEKCVGENGVTSACRCSLCGFEDNRFSMFNYCPNCGAKMEWYCVEDMVENAPTIIEAEEKQL